MLRRETKTAPSWDGLVESSGLLEGDIGVFYFKIPKRYVVSLAIVTVVKLVLATVLYFLLGLGSFDSFWMDTTRVEPLAQNNILLEVGSQATRWARMLGSKFFFVRFV